MVDGSLQSGARLDRSLGLSADRTFAVDGSCWIDTPETGGYGAEIQLGNPLTLFVALGGAPLFDGLAAADRITRPNVLLRFIRKPMEYASGCQSNEPHWPFVYWTAKSAHFHFVSSSDPTAYSSRRL